MLPSFKVPNLLYHAFVHSVLIHGDKVSPIEHRAKNLRVSDASRLQCTELGLDTPSMCLVQTTTRTCINRKEHVGVHLVNLLIQLRN